MDRVVVTVQDHGNTSAASIPLALSVGVAEGKIKRGDVIVSEAIGGGLARVLWFCAGECRNKARFFRLNSTFQVIDIDSENSSP